MTPNSRPVTRNVTFGAQTSTSTKIADSYSSNLMDDLFGDVDQILNGDLSDCMTFVGHRPKPIPATRTVQLPSNFAPRSAADIYRAAVTASEATHQPTATINPPAVPANPNLSYSAATTRHSQSDFTQPGSYPRRGRPITAPHFSNRSSGIPTTQQEGLRYGNLQSTVMSAPQRSAQSAATTQAVTVEVQPSPIQSVAHSLYPAEPLTETMLQTFSPRPPQTIFEPKKQQSVSLPFLLMGAAGISAASTLGIWAISQGGITGGVRFALGAEAAAAELPADSDQDFLIYLQKSLDTISARQAANQAIAVLPAPAAPIEVPTTVPGINSTQANVLPSLPGASNSSTNVIERVFVPIYQNGQTQSSQAQNSQTQNGQAQSGPQTQAPVPNVAVPTANVRPTVPVPQPVAAAAALPPSAPSSDIASIPIVPAANNTQASTLPAPGITVAAAPSGSAANELTNVTPSSEMALVGILNLGSRSAALFDVDGSSQRAYVGDRIGVSDWYLVSVNGQDVVIRQDGEVRSVYIGQRF